MKIKSEIYLTFKIQVFLQVLTLWSETLKIVRIQINCIWFLIVIETIGVNRTAIFSISNNKYKSNRYILENLTVDHLPVAINPHNTNYNQKGCESVALKLLPDFRDLNLY